MRWERGGCFSICVWASIHAGRNASQGSVGTGGASDRTGGETNAKKTFLAATPPLNLTTAAPVFLFWQSGGGVGGGGGGARKNATGEGRYKACTSFNVDDDCDVRRLRSTRVRASKATRLGPQDHHTGDKTGGRDFFCFGSAPSSFGDRVIDNSPIVFVLLCLLLVYAPNVSFAPEDLLRTHRLR